MCLVSQPLLDLFTYLLPVWGLSTRQTLLKPRSFGIIKKAHKTLFQNKLSLCLQNIQLILHSNFHVQRSGRLEGYFVRLKPKFWLCQLRWEIIFLLDLIAKLFGLLVISYCFWTYCTCINHLVWFLPMVFMCICSMYM